MKACNPPVSHPDAHVKLVQRRSQLADARVALGLVSGRGRLGSTGDAGDGLLDLLEHVISVGPCSGNIRVAEKSLGGRVQHCGILLQGPSGSCHLVPTVRVLQLLCVQDTKPITLTKLATKVCAIGLKVTDSKLHQSLGTIYAPLHSL